MEKAQIIRIMHYYISLPSSFFFVQILKLVFEHNWLMGLKHYCVYDGEADFLKELLIIVQEKLV